jgi:hypothetical protein
MGQWMGDVLRLRVPSPRRPVLKSTSPAKLDALSDVDAIMVGQSVVFAWRH